MNKYKKIGLMTGLITMIVMITNMTGRSDNREPIVQDGENEKAEEKFLVDAAHFSYTGAKHGALLRLPPI